MKNDAKGNFSTFDCYGDQSSAVLGWITVRQAEYWLIGR
jgi:hypothetical protein